MTEDSEYEFDVAVSFAGENREYVQDVVDALKAAGVRVFYDDDHAAAMWGEDLVEYFDETYRLKSRYAVIFVSHAYAEKMWTRHERRSALARGLEQETPYVLPVQLDDTALRGLRPTVGRLDARQVGRDGIVSAVLKKLGGQVPAEAAPVMHVPRTEWERQQVLLEQPPAWEYLYFAGELLRQRASVEDKYLDHEIGFAERTGVALTDGEALPHISVASDALTSLTGMLMKLMDQDVQQRALGAPGEPGSAERIRHLALRWNGIYVGILDWAAKLRGIEVPEEFRHLYELFAHFGDESVASYRRFLDDFAAFTDHAVDRIVAGEQVEYELTMKISIDQDLQDAFHAELDRLRAVLVH